MRHRGAGFAEAVDVGGIGMNHVGEPHVLTEPSEFCEALYGSLAVNLGQYCSSSMTSATWVWRVTPRRRASAGRLDHESLCADRKRARRQPDTHHRAR